MCIDLFDDLEILPPDDTGGLTIGLNLSVNGWFRPEDITPAFKPFIIPFVWDGVVEIDNGGFDDIFENFMRVFRMGFLNLYFGDPEEDFWICELLWFCGFIKLGLFVLFGVIDVTPASNNQNI